MNGAMAELCARISNTPKRNKVTSMGSIHQRLCPQKKEKSSAAIPKRWPAAFTKRMNASPYFERMLAECSNSSPTTWHQVIENTTDKSGRNGQNPHKKNKRQRFSTTENFWGIQSQEACARPGLGGS